VHAHRAAGERPQWCVDTGRAEGLHEEDGRGQPDAQARIAVVVGAVQPEQRQDADEFTGVDGGVAQSPLDGPDVGVRRADGHFADPRPAVAQRLDDRADGAVVAGRIRPDDQPRAGEARRGAGRHRRPGDAVPPRVHYRQFVVRPSPRRQGRKDTGERAVVVDPQRLRHGGEVFGLDGGPEPLLGRVPAGAAAGRRGAGRRGARRARCGERVEPVPLPLERVRRQADLLAAPAGGDRRPVDPQPAHVCCRHRVQQRVRLGPVGPQRRHHRGILHAGAAAQALPRHRGEDAGRAELQERGDPGGVQRVDAVRVAHRLPRMPHPVVGRLDQLGIRQLAGDVGDDGYVRFAELQVGRHGGELVEHRRHERRMEGVRDSQRLDFPAGLAPAGGEAGDDVIGTGHHDGGRAVHRGDADRAGQLGDTDRAGQVGDADRAGQPGDGGGHLRFGALDRQHRAAGQCLHQPPARRHQRAGVGEGQHAGDVCGGQLPDGVPEQVVRVEVPRLQQAEQCHLDGEQRGLGEGCLVEQPRLG
jgi:hypothetical protein